MLKQTQVRVTLGPLVHVNVNIFVRKVFDKEQEPAQGYEFLRQKPVFARRSCCPVFICHFLINSLGYLVHSIKFLLDPFIQLSGKLHEALGERQLNQSSEKQFVFEIYAISSHLSVRSIGDSSFTDTTSLLRAAMATWFFT